MERPAQKGGQAALLAGLLKAPSKYSPAASPGAARARSRVVLAKMVEAGQISRADEQKALAERILFAEPKTQKDQSGVEYAVQNASGMTMLGGS